MLWILSILVGLGSVVGLMLTEAPWWSWILGFFGGMIFVFIMFFLSAAFVTLVLGRKERVLLPKKIFTQYIYRACEFLVTFFRIKIIYEGKELLSDKEGYEFVCNHQSNFDPIITLRKINRKDLSFVMKMELINVFVVGRFLYSAAYYYIDRENNREGLKTIIQSSKAIQAKRPIGIYIEGTRSKGPQMGEFHNGSFKMAYRAQSDIVIGVIDNTYRIHKNFPWKKTTVLFKICKVLKYDEFKDLQTKDLDILVRKIMQDSLDEARIKYPELSK